MAGNDRETPEPPQSLSVGPMPTRQPAHPSITVEQISNLVDQFYGRVQQDARLGPIFAGRISGDWAPHLAKMKGFWRSVLLKTGEYKGRPVPVHVGIEGIVDEDYRIWLGLFRETVDDVFEEAARPVVIEAAERIAGSLWLSTSGNLLSPTPNWWESAS